jgi:hypothetical protein
MTMRGGFWILGACLLAVVALQCGSSKSSDSSAPIVGKLAGTRPVIESTPMPMVHVLVPILAERTDLNYANIAINGQWLERKNVPVAVVKATYGFDVPLDPTVAAANVSFALSAQPLAAFNGTAPAGAVFGQTMVTFAATPITLPPTPNDPFVGGGGAAGTSDPAPVFTLHPTGNPPAAPDEVHLDDFPNTQQDGHTCVPHSIASCIGYLVRKRGLACKFNYPGWNQDGGIGPGKLGANDGNQAMASDVFATYQDAGTYNEGEGGVNPPDILAGKKKFLDEKGLSDSIETTRIPADPTDTSPTSVYNGIKDALKAGCVVELVLRIHQNDPKHGDYSHMVSVVGFKDTGTGDATAQSITIHDSQRANENNDPENGIGDDVYSVVPPGDQTWSWPNNSQSAVNPYAKFEWAIKQCPKPGATSCAGLTTTPPGNAGTPPVLNSFNATFNQGCFCTSYTASATDPTGGTLHYTWTNSNPCGQFTGGDAPNATWTHPDSTNPGACPNQPVHPGSITVVIKGGGGSLTCVYAGGSGDGSAVTCTPGL